MSAEDTPQRTANGAASREGEAGASERVLADITPERLRELVPEHVLRAVAMSEASLALTVRAAEDRFPDLLPPPKVLREYDEIVPGSAEKIVSNSISEGPHRRRRENRGQRYALVALFVILAAVLGCVHMGAPWTGCVLAVVGVGGLFATTSVFGFSRVSRNS